MKLLITPTSPYARKAKVVALEKKLPCDFIAVAPWDNDPQIVSVNPLRKVPVLIDDNHAVILDSRVICEYLDALSDSPRFLPADAATRTAVKTREAIIEGAMDSALAIIMAGRIAPDMQHAAWRGWLMDKVDAALSYLEQTAATRNFDDLSDVACYCLLDTLLFRLGDSYHWQSKYPSLAAWFDRTGARESLKSTDPRE